MILLTPDKWVNNLNQPVGKPVSLLSGNRMVWLTAAASIHNLNKAGIPKAVLPVVDYLRLLRRNPGPDGNPTGPIPTPYANVGL